MISRTYKWSENSNYALDLCLFHMFRKFSDGITYFRIDINSDFYKGDHNPQFSIRVAIMNFNIFDFCIYNVNHLKEGPTT